jgi:hypothetical protein
LRIAALLIVSIAIACVAGCKSTPHEQPPAPGFVAFEKRINENGVATFRSWNGKAHRMNSDVELAFFPNNTVQMLQWGISLVHYDGQYTLDREGRIIASFDDYQAQWPMTQLELHGDTLLLRPTFPNPGLLMGEGGAAPQSDSGFWPFRMLTGDEERKVLEQLEPHVAVPSVK